VALLDELFSAFDAAAERHGVEKIKTIGDAYMAVAGVPEERPDHVEAAADMGLEMRDSLSKHRWPGDVPIVARIGIACGPVIAGIIGQRKFAYDVWGDTVNAASRLESAASPGSIQVSDAVRDRLCGTHAFRGPYLVDLKGKGETRTHTLVGRLPTESPVLAS
jgi:adenylate cyclase